MNIIAIFSTQGKEPLHQDLHRRELNPGPTLSFAYCACNHRTRLSDMPRPKRDIQAVADETVTPPNILSNSQTIARVKQASGNNLYQLELPSGKAILAELPARFRSTIWIKRGSFVLVDTSTLADRENKLGGEIVNVVREERAWRKTSYWPPEFQAKTSSYVNDSDDDEGPKMPSSDSEDEV